MGREIRRVSQNWIHPKYTDGTRTGQYIPLYEWSNLSAEQREWDRRVKQWENGFIWERERWIPKTPDLLYVRWEEYYGTRPSYSNRMPRWSKEEATHFQLYETTTEGTPQTPPFLTLEEVAIYCSEHGVTTFANQTASYEEWLSFMKRGWAPSVVMKITNQKFEIVSGVAGLKDK